MINKIGLILLVSFIGISCQAQIIDNSLTFSFGYHTGSFLGQREIMNGDFKFPSFYSNLESLSGFSANAYYKIHPNISLGAGLSNSSGSNWVFNEQQEFQSAEVSLLSFSANLQLHSNFKQRGFFNRFKIYFEFFPLVGSSRFNSPDPLFNILTMDGDIQIPKERQDMYYGLGGNVGLQYSLSQLIGLMISYSVQHYRINSIMYPDEHFTSSQLNLGLTLKLVKDKKYFYKY